MNMTYEELQREICSRPVTQLGGILRTVVECCVDVPFFNSDDDLRKFVDAVIRAKRESASHGRVTNKDQVLYRCRICDAIVGIWLDKLVIEGNSHIAFQHGTSSQMVPQFVYHTCTPGQTALAEIIGMRSIPERDEFEPVFGAAP